MGGCRAGREHRDGQAERDASGAQAGGLRQQTLADDRYGDGEVGDHEEARCDLAAAVCRRCVVE